MFLSPGNDTGDHCVIKRLQDTRLPALLDPPVVMALCNKGGLITGDVFNEGFHWRIMYLYTAHVF